MMEEVMESREGKGERQLNLELLRILSMLMIVLMHLINHGGVLEWVEDGSPSYYLVWTLFGISFVAINCYVLISGYFLCESRFSFRRIAKTEGQVWFYSILLYLAAVFLFGQEIDISTLVSAVFPVLSCEYWFVTMYIGMLLLSPFVNRLLNGLSRGQFTVLLGICYLLFSVWPTVFFFSVGLNFGGGSGVVWFLVLYITGAYLRRFQGDLKKGSGHRWLIAACLLALIPASRFAIEGILASPLGKIGFLQDLMWGYSIFYQYHSVLVLAASIALFLAFSELKIKRSGRTAWIGLVAPLTFGVYLLHDNPNLRGTLWGTLEPAGMCGKWYLIPVILGMALGLFAVCAAVEALRRGIFKGIETLLRRARKGKAGPIERLCARLDERIFRKNGL